MCNKECSRQSCLLSLYILRQKKKLNIWSWPHYIIKLESEKKIRFSAMENLSKSGKINLNHD